MKKPSLLQNFTLALLLILLVVGFSLGRLLTLFMEQDMYSQFNKDYSKFVSHEIADHFNASNFLDLDLEDGYEQRAKQISTIQFNSNFLYLKVWDKNGLLIWSSKKEELGLKENNQELMEVFEKGKVHSEMVDKKSIVEKYGYETSNNEMELYLPVRSGPKNEISLVFEIYYNIDELLARIENHNKMVWMAVLLSILVIYGILFALVAKASKLIKLQNKQIINAKNEWEDTFDTINDAITVHDKDFNVIRANKAALELLGTSFEKLLRQKCFVSYHGQPQPPVNCSSCETCRTGIESTTEIFEPHLNKYLEIKAHPRYRKGKELIGVVHVVRDITERYNFEKKLRESEERFRHLYTKTPAMLHSIDSDGVIINVSDTWLEKIGYEKEEVIGRKLTDFLAEESRRLALESDLPDFFRKGFCKNINYSFVKKNGEIIEVLLSAILERDDGGNVINSYAIMEDITEKRSLEEQIRHNQKMDAIGTMAGGIAHDFNNILSIIMSASEMALEDSSDGSLSNHFNKIILQAALRAKNITKTILTFSHRSKQELTFLKLGPVIEEDMNLIRATMPSTVKIQQSIETECGQIKADSSQIHQLLLNLCTNAVHAMDEQGVLEVKLQEVILAAEELAGDPDMIPGRYAKITVTDNGSGMSEETAGRIFEPFYTTKKVGEGTGMGLSVVHGIVKGHGGMIRVKSKLGEGTSFEIFFPIVTPKAENFSVEYSDTLPLGNEKILFVDDEKTIGELGGSLLKRLGYDVTVKTCGKEALQIFKASPYAYDLVITDQTMPNISGADLAIKLREINPSIPIILCTGYSNKITQEKAEEIGIREFMLKPLDNYQLASTVRSVLDS